MTPSEIRRVLKANRKAGIPPWTQRHLAQMWGSTDVFINRVLSGWSKSAPFSAWCDAELGPTLRGLRAERAARAARAAQKKRLLQEQQAS